MTRVSLYRKNTHLRDTKIRQILRYFCEDVTASQTAKLLKIRRATINDRYDYCRHVIFLHQEKSSKMQF